MNKEHKDSKLKKEIGKRLRIARENRGFTQAEMGELLGITDVGYSRYEKGSDLRSTLIILFCEKLECSPSWLLGVEEEGMRLPPESPILRDLRAACELLNKEGQNRLVGYANDMLDTPKFRKKGGLTMTNNTRTTEEQPLMQNYSVSKAVS